MANKNVLSMNRAELYSLIESDYENKDDFIRSEMLRLGFWEPDPTDNKAEQIQQLQEELKKKKFERNNSAKALSNCEIEDTLKKNKKARLVESRKKMQENRLRREEERKQKVQEWNDFTQKNIHHLGTDVSHDLNNHNTNTERLLQNLLPMVKTPEELASAIGISLADLRFLSYDRPVSTVTHYVRFSIPKGNGSVRVISAPRPKLKAVQHWILEQILYKIPLNDAAHGFVSGRSIKTNAEPHASKAVVINMDLKDFFPSITYPRVKGMFVSLGYSPAISTILSLLCCEPEVYELDIDGVQTYVRSGKRFLPQGAPTSPTITNILCRKMDARIQGYAQKYQWTYTRYADDLSFSHLDKNANVGGLLHFTRKVIQEEGFVEHPRKTHIMRSGSRKEVTGLSVECFPNVERKTLKKFRALLHHIKTKGLDGAHWNGKKDKELIDCILGFASYVYMIHPSKGANLLQQAKEISSRLR